MQVETAHLNDMPCWLTLAKEVEFLFGPMTDRPEFHQALQKNIHRKTALCIREKNGPPGNQLMGGLLFSSQPSQYTIGWLSVAEKWRRHGVASRLINLVLNLVTPPAEIVVTTFGADVPAGEPARRFYEQMGFQPAESAPPGPEGGSRQIYKMFLSG